MRVVVTGGAGFLGSHLCDRLLADGEEVVCVDNLLTGQSANIARLLDNPRFRFARHDVTEPMEMIEATAQPGTKPVTGDEPVDAVLHFASPASPVDYHRFPLETLMAGALGTMNMVELARRHNARFILASTSEVYGDPKVHPQPETYWGNVNPIGPRSMYDEAKRYAEALVTAYRRQYGINAGIVRIFNTYGPGMRPRDGRAIPTFVTQALAGEPLTVAGDGSQTRSVCYVDDLVDGVVRLLRSDLTEPLNIGNPHEMTIFDLARLVIELCDADVPIQHVPLPENDPMVRRPDISQARKKLGWSPKVDLRVGLGRTIDCFRSELAAGRSAPAIPSIPTPRGKLDHIGLDRSERGNS